MPKSSLRKNQEKQVTTNLVIGFDDTLTVASAAAETGGPIYIVPRKAEAMFQRCLWTVALDQNPDESILILYAILQAPSLTTLTLSQLAFAQTSLMVIRQSWENLTSVGVVDTATSKEVDMKELVLSRLSNLQSDDDFSIVTAYRQVSGGDISVAQTGTLWIKETLFQKNFKDDLDEWAGYTYEESAS